MIIIVCFIFFSFFAVFSSSYAHRCYVCGRDAEEPFKDRQKSKRDASTFSSTTTGTNNSSTKVAPKCDVFEKNDNIEQFAMECPSGYSSCLTQIEGKLKMLWRKRMFIKFLLLTLLLHLMHFQYYKSRMNKIVDEEGDY